jgi:hypothetical protein
VKHALVGEIGEDVRVGVLCMFQHLTDDSQASSVLSEFSVFYVVRCSSSRVRIHAPRCSLFTF